MVVALGAFQTQAQPDVGGRFDPVHDVVDAEFFGDNASFVGCGVIAVETSGDLLGGGGVGQEVARELFHRKLVEGHVRGEGLNHPVTPPPHLAGTVRMIHAGVAVPREIHPQQGHAFAVLGGGQHALDQFGVGVGAFVLKERRQFCRRRRQAGEVQVQAARLHLRGCGGRGTHSLRSKSRAYKGVQSGNSSIRPGLWRAHRRHKGPVARVGCAGGNPSFQRLHLLRRQAFSNVSIRGRHDFVRVLGRDARQQFAFGCVFLVEDLCGTFGGVQTEFTLARVLVRSVAVVTLVGENGPHFPVEVGRDGLQIGSRQADQRCSQGKETVFHSKEIIPKCGGP